MSQNKQNKIQIKYENAINYKPNPDSDYFVSDLLQNHLKLRVLQSGSKVWVYDYIYNNKRKRYTFGKLAKEKPKLIEKIVNRGSERAGRCVEIAGGSPLTEKELLATKKSEINTECPSIANPNYESY